MDGARRGEVVSDPRFASLHNDPRFAKFSKKGSKAPVDSRFAQGEDVRFQDATGRKHDKRPRDDKKEAVGQKSTSAYTPKSDGTLKSKTANASSSTAVQATERDADGHPSKRSKASSAPAADSRFSAGAAWKDDSDDARVVNSGKAAARAGAVVDGSDDDEDSDDEFGGSDDEADMDEYARALAEDAGEDGLDSDDDGDAAGAASSSSQAGGNRRKETVEERLERLTKMARGEYDFSGSEAGSSSDEDDDEDDDKLAERVQEQLHGKEDVQQDPDAPDLNKVEYMEGEGGETNRLALVNCDWDNLRAVDIYAVLQSFLPSGRSIASVAVYPSEYGLKKMQEETAMGPRNIFKPSKDDDAAASSSAGAGKASGKRAVLDLSGARKSNRPEREDDAFDQDKLRQYELNRMKYFYCIITFDSVAAASSVYNSCDGMEFEASSNVLDLRYVPADQKFDAHPPRDIARSIPSIYTPPEFFTRALQSSKVNLTWDGDDVQRSRALDWDKLKTKETKKVKQKQNKRNNGRKAAPSRGDDDDDDDNLGDLKNYLASSESESDGDDAGYDGVDDDGSAGDDGDDLMCSDGDAGSGNDGDAASGSEAGSKMENEGGEGKSSKAARSAKRKAERNRLRSLLLGEKDDKKQKQKDKRGKPKSGADADALYSDDDAAGAGGDLLDDDDDDSSSDDGLDASGAVILGKGAGSKSDSLKGVKSSSKASKRASAAGGISESRDADGDRVMSITANPTLGKDVLKKKAERESKENESSWEAYLRKKKEKKKAKKEAWKAQKTSQNASGGGLDRNAAHGAAGSDSGSDGDAHDDDLGDDSFFDSGKKSKGKTAKSKVAEEDGDDDDAARRRAQLDLLRVGDDYDDDGDGDGSGDEDAYHATKTTGRNYSLKALQKQQKEADRKAKKDAKTKKHQKDRMAVDTSDIDGPSSAAAAASASGSEFKVNTSDSRFSAVFNLPEFSIDPTAPQYKDTAGMRKILDARSAAKQEQRTAKGATSAAGAGGSAPPAARPMVVVRSGASKSSGAGSAAAASDGHGDAGSAMDNAADVRALAGSLKSKLQASNPAGESRQALPSAAALSGFNAQPHKSKKGR